MSYLYLVNRTKRVTMGANIASLVTVRIFDLLAAACMFVVASLLGGNLSPVVYGLEITASIFLGLGVLVIAFTLLLGERIAIALEVGLQHIGLFRFRVVSYSCLLLREILGAFEVLKSSGTLNPVLAATLLRSLLAYLATFALVNGMGVEVSIWQVFMGGTVALLTTALPVQGFMGLGTAEVGWAFGFTLVGLSLEDAITTGFGYHIIILLYASLLGALGWLGLSGWRRPSWPGRLGGGG